MSIALTPVKPSAGLSRWSRLAVEAGMTRELKSDRVAKALEQQILSGTLVPGTALPSEADFCDILGVSRTVLRDAMRTLVARGLVSVSRGRPTTVANPSDEAFANSMTSLLARSGLTMGEVMRSRETIETMIVSLAAQHGTDKDWQVLQSAYDSLSAAVEANDNESAAAAHAEFHLGILHAAHQPALSIILAPMSKVAALTSVASVQSWRLQDWEVEAHLPVVRALMNRDVAAAHQAMHLHFAESTRPSTYQSFLDQPFAEAHYGQQDATP